jgi:regulator of sirC expression with transglutaminase-like and TPR domain
MSARSHEEIRRQLEAAVGAPTPDLATVALWIAAAEYPSLDVASYRERISAHAAEARRRAAGDDVASVRYALVDEIFVRSGFAGNAADYDDPRNSYLNDVLDRRLGIPITLAVVYLGAARDLAQPASGVNAPGHFLVRHGDAILDPFHRGQAVERAELLRQLRRMKAREPGRALDELLDNPPDARAVASRMLANLKMHHLRRRDLPRALAAVDRLVALNPDQPHWLRDRAALYQHLDCARAAIADLELYLKRAPDDPEADVVRTALVRLLREAPQVH